MKLKKLVAIVSLLLVACLCLVFAACNDDPETTQLTAPVITLDSETGTVSWKKVEHADSYDVKVNNGAAINVTTTSYVFPSSTAEGTYKVTVTAKSTDTAKYSASKPSNEVTYTKSASSTDKVLTQLTMTQEPTKSVYFLDELVTEVDFTGAAFLAKYDNGSSKSLTINDLDVDDYTMTEGDFDVTVSYTENDVTKQFTVTFELRERTDADIDVNGVEIIVNDQNSVDYIVANSLATKVANMRGDVLEITLNEDTTSVSTSALTIGRNLLSVTDGDGTQLVLVVVGTPISSPDEFKAMAADVANSQGKYYVLTRDLDFENAWQDPVGAAPIAVSHIVDTENIYTPDPVNGAPGDGDGAPKDEEGNPMDPVKNQNGVAFLGTLDGLGHTIMNYRVKEATNWKAEGYGRAMFGWLGEDAKICNLNLRNVSTSGGGYAATLVGVNSGTIENVSLEESCNPRAVYHHTAAFVGYNFGTIKNVVSLIANPQIELAYKGSGVVDETVKNGFADNGDHTAKLGGGWRYFDGIGTLYVTPSYVRINSTDHVLAIGNDELALDVIIQEGDPANVEVTFFGPYASQLSYEWRAGKLYVKIANIASTTLVGGESINMAVSGSGTTATFTIDITAAYVTGYDLLDGDNNVVAELPVSITEGLNIDLDTINVRKNMSDGTSSTIHPTRLDGYDANGSVGAVQTVKAFYGTGDNDYVTLKVTLIAKAVTGIAMSAQPAKATYTIGTDTVLDLTGAKINVSYNNGTSGIIDVTSAMLDGTTYDLTTAGAYNVKVSYGGSECTFGITVKDAAVTVTGIAIVGTPAKDTYKLNSAVSALADLAGATITATMSSGDPTTGIAITDAMISGGYDFSTAGSTDITVTYEGKTATIAVTVVDYATALKVTPKAALPTDNGIPQLAYSKTTALDLLAAADYALVMASGTTVNADTSKISASEAEAGQHEITYTYTDDYATVSEKQTYDIWYELAQGDETAAQAWALMQANRAGYYRLTKDLDFEEAVITTVGKQPVQGGDDTTCNVDNPYADGLEQKGVPFTGKFDGDGYTIKYFKIEGSSFNGDGFGLSMFGYVGATGEVKNFTLKNATVKSKNQTAFIATVNEGLIENVVVDSTCAITANWLTAGVVTYNKGEGTVRNVVCYVTTVVKEDNVTTGALNVIYTNYATAENCFAASSEDFLTASATLGTETDWVYVENYGPVYKRYVVLTNVATTMALDGEWTFTLTMDASHAINFIYIRSGINSEWYGCKKGENNTYTIKLSDALKEKLQVGQTYSFAINVTNNGYLPGQLVTITEPQEGL
ncbi:MAG: bacterial Ig-like domain-containing protein [Corallococcus sp.]|nr:bacterial Ig-like domain-containing protein [Corallococcus sp.]MCM1359585.1 bacterial Ig-like domain-containing protein [Corallococcus sp.]MCM1395177.1 bacterial Ig-like domain-containing protein [Corallococcus sp.]